jgi:hypothetical protein
MVDDQQLVRSGYLPSLNRQLQNSAEWHVGRDASVARFLFLRQHQVDAAAFAQPPFVQLEDNLFYRPCHGLEITLSAAVGFITHACSRAGDQARQLKAGPRMMSVAGCN